MYSLHLRGFLVKIAAYAVICGVGPSLQAAKDSYIINIDQPSFRKLVVGVPQFATDKSKELVELAQQGQNELIRLLKFTRLFNIIDSAAFSGYDTSKFDFESVNQTNWKALGVESVILVDLKREGQRFRLELRTTDINHGKQILGKAYTMNSRADLAPILKRFVDRLLVAYTGKPGIFASKLVFVGKKTKADEKQIFLCDIDGSNLEQLTFDKTMHLSPSFDPSGQKVLFTSYRDGNPDLYQIDLKTKKTSKVSGVQGVNSGGVYSTNGKVIAFTGTREGNADIFITNPSFAKREALLVGQGLDVDPAFSPDGKYLAFVSGRYGNPHIFRAELLWSDSEQRLAVTSDKRLTYAGWYNATPAWSPDSRKIAFAGFDKDIGRFDLFVMNSDGTELERLTLKSGDNENPSWSPNGQLIVFHSNRIGDENQKGPAHLYMMNRDGSGQTMINLPLYDAQTPKWSQFLIADGE